MTDARFLAFVRETGHRRFISKNYVAATVLPYNSQ